MFALNNDRRVSQLLDLNSILARIRISLSALHFVFIVFVVDSTKRVGSYKFDLIHIFKQNYSIVREKIIILLIIYTLLEFEFFRILYI